MHIAEQDTLYRFLFDNILDAVVYARTDGGADSSETIVAANPVACQLFGYGPDELPGMTRDQLIFEGDAQFQQALQYREATRSFAGQLTFRRKDGSPLLAEVGSRLVNSRDGSMHSVNIIRDVSERAHADAERARQARFEAIAQLTSGIAHDFNNLLTVVQGSLELLLEDLPAGARARDYAANALLCAERGAALTGQLLTYARRQFLRLQGEDLNARIRELLPLVQATVGSRIEVVLDLQDPLPPCRTDIAQLTTALLNLAANGRDAMPDGGRLMVETRHALNDPGMVLLRVCDTGQGVPEALRDRIFEPYFTTKTLGAGLGLAMVQGFVHQSGGLLQLHSPPGGGTCFELRLPVAEVIPAVPAAPSPLAASAGGRILLVDDNPLIREQTRERLQRAGYEVATAQDSDEALVQLQAAPVDLLLTDLDMPGSLDGLQLTREVRTRWPDLPVVVMTGHDPLSLASLQGHPRLLSLPKPFDSATLLGTIASLLAPAH